jgi:pyruvate/2-oxoglutarate dehydrogenase complex dihydrolipoamide acyltransferase (E2) component
MASASSSFPTWARAWPRPNWSNGTSRSATWCARTRSRRGDDRQGDRRDPRPGRRHGVWLGAEVGDTVAVGSPLVKLDVAGEAAPRRRARGRPSRGRGGRKPRTPRRRPSRSLRRRTGAGTQSRCEAAQAQAPGPAPPPRRRRGAAPRGRAAAGLAGGAPARQGGGRRSAPGAGHRAGRAHHPRGPRRLHRPRPPAGRPGLRRAPRWRRSRSSACAAASPRRWRWPKRASRTSPMSRRSTSPRWRSCAPAERREAGRPAAADHPAVPDARDGQGDRRAARGQRPSSTTRPA